MVFPHIDYLRNSLSNVLGIFNTKKYDFPKHILRLLFFAYFMTRLNYGLCIWSNTYVS